MTVAVVTATLTSEGEPATLCSGAVDAPHEPMQRGEEYHQMVCVCVCVCVCPSGVFHSPGTLS